MTAAKKTCTCRNENFTDIFHFVSKVSRDGNGTSNVRDLLLALCFMCTLLISLANPVYFIET